MSQAEQQQLTLIQLYLSSIPDGAFKVSAEVDGQTYDVNLNDYLAVNSPDKPLDRLRNKGERQKVYTQLTNKVTLQIAALEPLPQREPNQREELAIAISVQSDRLEYCFSTLSLPDFARPALEHPDLDSLAPDNVSGDELLQLLFGKDVTLNMQILQAVFNTKSLLKPDSHPLRIHLLTSDERLWALPWNHIAYQNRPLYLDGWTVELHASADVMGFPEYPAHTCFFPGQVVLAGIKDTADDYHFNDLQHFFQRYWPEQANPEPLREVTTLRDQLSSGSARLLYYFGEASSAGLHLGDPQTSDERMPWAELNELLQHSHSVSIVFLNLLGAVDTEVINTARELLSAAKLVLIQYHSNQRSARTNAARAGIDWLHSVFVKPQLDPVVALYRQQQSGTHITAWTQYSGWRLLSHSRPDNPDLVNLLLDRHRQRADLLQAKEYLAGSELRRIHHSVAFGLTGCRVGEFPRMASMHLKRYGKKPNEVVLHRSLSVTLHLTKQQQIDEAVQRQYKIAPRQSIIKSLLKEKNH